MKTVADFNFQNEKVLLRVDFNVPLNSRFQITDNSRIKAAIPTIQHILNQGGAVILMSHLGRPKNGPEDAFSLKHIVEEVQNLLNTTVHFVTETIGKNAENAAKNLQSGEVLLLENLRFNPQETQGDLHFAEELSKLGTFYVNDAFGAAHRTHASTAIIAQFFNTKKCFGFLMANEINNARKLMQNPERPFTAIVGGAKVSDKLLIIENLMNIANNILIGGGMAYTFAKALGGNIGQSLCEENRIDLCKALIAKAKEKNVNLVLASDSITANKFAEDAHTLTEPNHLISEGYMGLDIGPESIKHFTAIIENSKSVLWNGPMGVFELKPFSMGTYAVAKALKKVTQNGGYTLIGGGDSAAAIHQFGLTNDVSFVSTGGGALLEIFEGKVLPGINAIENSQTRTP